FPAALSCIYTWASVTTPRHWPARGGSSEIEAATSRRGRDARGGCHGGARRHDSESCHDTGVTRLSGGSAGGGGPQRGLARREPPGVPDGERERRIRPGQYRVVRIHALRFV